MGAMAESFGLRAGAEIPKTDQGRTRNRSANRAGIPERLRRSRAGTLVLKVPSLFGGSHKQAEAHLRASLTYDAESTASRFFLAELLIDEGRKDEARAELQRVIDAPLDPQWTPEDQEFKGKARQTLAQLK